MRTPFLVFAALAATAWGLPVDPAAVTSNDFPRSEVAVLLDETKVEVAADGSFTAVRHVRSKVLAPRGRRAAETLIPFNEKYQQVEFRYAKATLPDGSQRAVKPEEVATATLLRGYPAYGEVKAMGYAIPGVEVGAVLDQEYAQKSKPQMGDHFWMQWRPRSGAPLFQAQLVIRVPASRKVQWRAHNAELQPQIAESDDKRWKTFTCTMTAPHELTAEPYMPVTDEVVPWLEMSSVESWNDVARWLDEVTAPQVDSSPELEARVRGVTAGLTSPAEKLAALFYWMEDHVQFVKGMELGPAGYKPRAASQTYRTLYGDAKDLCVLLVAMLRDAGIPARLAFLESGSARNLRDRLPMLRYLNHCIVVAEVEGRTYYLDPTAETARADTILGRVCNTELLLLGKDANKLVPGPQYDGSKHGTRERVQLELAADGSVKGQIRVEYLGETDAATRSKLKRLVRAGEARELMERRLRESLPTAQLLDHEFGDVSVRTSNYVTTVRFEAPNWATIESDQIRFKPQLPQNVKLSDEMFAKSERQFPIQFFESEPSESEMAINLPEGFTVDSVPKDVEMSSPFSYWKRTIQTQGQKLVIREKSHLKTARLPKESLADIRAYYQEAAARKNELVVLKKK